VIVSHPFLPHAAKPAQRLQKRVGHPLSFADGEMRPCKAWATRLGNIKSESDYYPWGGELQFVNNDSNHYKFTGKERDETGLDYFGARYYSNGLARFITPDWSSSPMPVPYADFGDPQSLNQYSYVRNIPTSRADADGHCPGGDCGSHFGVAESTAAMHILGGLLKGLATSIVNAIPQAYNAGASLLNAQIENGSQPDVPLLPLAPTLPVNGPAEAVGNGIGELAMIAVGGAKSEVAEEPTLAPYNRAEHYGNPSTSQAAKEIRARWRRTAVSKLQKKYDIRHESRPNCPTSAHS